jgi:hypothetical protein
MTEEDIHALHKVCNEIRASRHGTAAQFNEVLRMIQKYGHAVVFAEALKP